MAESVFCKYSVLSFPTLQKIKSVQVQLDVHMCVYFDQLTFYSIILMNWFGDLFALFC